MVLRNLSAGKGDADVEKVPVDTVGEERVG